MAQFEWQFENEHGSWVTYGKSNQGNDYSTTTTSNDIEKHFFNNPNKMPMLIESIKFQYVLDFEAMTQTNQQTSVKRKIRRVKSTQDNPTTAASKKVGENAWFFRDEHNRWIKYGEASKKNASTYATRVSSNAIEQHFTKNSTSKMDISSENFKYVLDFQNMTQTNTSTSKARSIRRLFAYSEGGRSDDPPAGSNILPVNWAPMDHPFVSVIRLNTSQQEYINQATLIKKSLPDQIINNIYRIQHKYLWRAYENRTNFQKERFPGVFNEKYLFHGTNKSNLENIYTENFDNRLYGRNVGNLYGRGTYFSSSSFKVPLFSTAGYSADYCSGGPPKVMFIVRVLVGRIAKGNTSMDRPPNDSLGRRCDTTVDDEAKPTIFVKYEAQEYYPAYYFEFGLREATVEDNGCTIL